MKAATENRQFFDEYMDTLNKADKKTRELLSNYVTDEHLIKHILFFEKAFPNYQLIADEITSEDDRVVLYGRFKGTHLGELNGILPTSKTVELPVAVGYKITNNKIVDHWMVIDQTALMDQLNVANVTER